jgi:hypothetical protein
MSEYHIGKTRLRKLKCRVCGRHIPKGSNCLFTRWTWDKMCLECGKKFLSRVIERYKNEIKSFRKMVKQMGNPKLHKENMCASLQN